MRAAQLYSLAIEHNPGDATLFCNRAYTRIKLEEHGYAYRKPVPSKSTPSMPKRTTGAFPYIRVSW